MGVLETMGLASGQVSTMPPQLRIMRTRLKMGKSSSAAAIWPSTMPMPPRWA